MPTLIIETGTSVPNANSYVSLAEAKAYHELRGNEWEGEDEQLNRALIVARESLESLYGPNFRGAAYEYSTNRTLFPRYWFRDANGRLNATGTIPECLKNAQCELALMFTNGDDLFPIASTAQNVSSESVTVGPISESITYGSAVSGESFPGFRKIDLILAPILNSKRNANLRLGL